MYIHLSEQTRDFKAVSQCHGPARLFGEFEQEIELSVVAV